jgi:predicted AAA+ superfamily ATPase
VELEKISLKKITKDTLIFFDEIQDCTLALASLKYFYEEGLEYDIIAAWGLVGTVSNRDGYSSLVGKVNKLIMRPMNFYEFLLALGYQQLASLISDCYNNDAPIFETHHVLAMSLYRTYLIVGGMPKAVEEYVNNKDFEFVRSVQNQILNDYATSSTKYTANKNDGAKIMAIYTSIPYQLARENKKFQYSLINSNARAVSYEESLAWLIEAALVDKTNKVNHGLSPLYSYIDATSYKIYLNDIGLLTTMSNLAPMLILNGNYSGEYKGALTENYVSQQLVFNGYDMCYWESPGEAKLGFVVQKDDEVIPLDVKDAENTKAKSLSIFINKYDIKKSIRISGKNFGFENGIKSVPLYAVWCIK